MGETSNSGSTAIGHDEIRNLISDLYKEASSWTKNNFLIPRGKAGNEFVQEMTRILNLFNMKTEYEERGISLAIIFTTLLTQKPSQNSRAKKNAEYLAKRMQLWKNQDIERLMSEGKEIQKRLSKSRKKKEKSKEKTFSRLMMIGEDITGDEADR